jgi:hypothetical protein
MLKDDAKASAKSMKHSFDFDSQTSMESQFTRDRKQSTKLSFLERKKSRTIAFKLRNSTERADRPKSDILCGFELFTLLKYEFTSSHVYILNDLLTFLSVRTAGSEKFTNLIPCKESG